MTSQKNYQACPEAKIKSRKKLSAIPQNVLLLGKLTLLVVSFVVIAQYDSLSSFSFIANCELSLGSNISLRAAIELK